MGGDFEHYGDGIPAVPNIDTRQIIVICTGGFDPIHEGHIKYLQTAKSLGDILVVGLNSTDWLLRKKGYYFQTFEARLTVLEAIKYVDRVIRFNDKDGSGVDAIRLAKLIYPDSKYIFANGGDRTMHNIPEMDAPRELINGVEFAFGIGGETKLNSSSELVKKVKEGERFKN